MSKIFCKAALVGLGLLAAATSANAQTADRKTAVGLHANATQYRGDLGNAFWKWDDMPYSGGIDITQYVGRWLDLRLDLDYTRLRFPQNPGTSVGANQPFAGYRFRAQAYQAGLGFKLKLPVKDSFFLHPYLLV